MTRPSPQALIKPDPDEIDFVMSYGGRCRDCADQNGTCPMSGLPCDPKQARRVVAHVIEALNYKRYFESIRP